MDMIKKAKEILAGMDAKLVSMGKIPQVTYIFRAKNFYQMSDNSVLTVVPGSPIGAETDQKALESKIVNSIVEEE
jgi:hypothetical protein